MRLYLCQNVNLLVTQATKPLGRGILPPPLPIIFFSCKQALKTETDFAPTLFPSSLIWHRRSWVTSICQHKYRAISCMSRILSCMLAYTCIYYPISSIYVNIIIIHTSCCILNAWCKKQVSVFKLHPYQTLVLDKYIGMICMWIKY